MPLTTTKAMEKKEKEYMLTQEMNIILSLPEKAFHELMSDCKQKGIVQAARENHFDADVLFLAYQNYIEQHSVAEKEKHGIVRESLICNVEILRNSNSPIKYVIGRNYKGELLFYQKYSTTAMRDLKRILLKNTTELLKQDSKKMTSSLNRIRRKWKWYIKNENKIKQLKEQAKTMLKTKEDKKTWSIIQIKLWELNNANLAIRELEYRVSQMESILKNIEPKNTKVENQHITWENISHCIPGTNVTQTISEKDFLLKGIFNITELQCENLSQIKASNSFGNTHIYTYRMLTRNLHDQANHFFLMLQQCHLTKEDLTPRLKKYYEQYVCYLYNIDFLNLLNKHHQLEKHPELLCKLLTTNIEGCETNIGYLSRTEWSLLETYFEMKYLTSFKPTLDGYKEIYLLESKDKNYIPKKTLPLQMKERIQKMLSELESSNADNTSYTPTFTKLLEHARWFLSEEDPLQVMLNGNAPKIDSEKPPVKKKS